MWEGFSFTLFPGRFVLPIPISSPCVYRSPNPGTPEGQDGDKEMSVGSRRVKEKPGGGEGKEEIRSDPTRDSFPSLISEEGETGRGTQRSPDHVRRRLRETRRPTPG